MSSRTRIDVVPGQRYRKTMPASEVCMHMQIDDKVFEVELLPGRHMAQLYYADGPKKGTDFSFPITAGEAGFYYDEAAGNYYFYQSENVDHDAEIPA